MLRRYVQDTAILQGHEGWRRGGRHVRIRPTPLHRVSSNFDSTRKLYLIFLFFQYLTERKMFKIIIFYGKTINEISGFRNLIFFLLVIVV